MDDYVGNLLGEKNYDAFCADYQLPSNELLTQKPWFGKSSKGKKISILEQESKRKAFIPAPDRKAYNWSKMRIEGGRQSKQPRITQAEQIIL